MQHEAPSAERRTTISYQEAYTLLLEIGATPEEAATMMNAHIAAREAGKSRKEAARDVGKALGLTDDIIDEVVSDIYGEGGDSP